MDIFGDLGFRAGGIFFTFGPLLLLSLSVTMDRKNWKILYQHPYIVLLAVFTYFTFSKKKILCGGATDSRLVFSKKLTYFNMLLNSILTVVVCILAYFSGGFSAGAYPNIKIHNDNDMITLMIMVYSVLLLTLILSSVLTILFLHMPSCCCCGGFGCCNIHNDVHMYDADIGLVIRQDDQDANNDIEMAEH